MKPQPQPQPKPPAAGRGRPKGALNKTTRLVHDFANHLVSDTSYTKNLSHRILTGQCAPAIELYFWQLLGGKPKEQHDIHQTGSLRVTWESSS